MGGGEVQFQILVSQKSYQAAILGRTRWLIRSLTVDFVYFQFKEQGFELYNGNFLAIKRFLNVLISIINKNYH